MNIARWLRAELETRDEGESVKDKKPGEARQTALVARAAGHGSRRFDV
jgi:hypothetical protein